MKRWLLIILFVAGAWHGWQGRVASHSPGEVAPLDPQQRGVGSDPDISRNGYRIEALARFDIEARVLSKETYRVDREADLAPVDLALGWGPMSDSAVLDKIRISQGNRFYFWQVDEFPIPREDIVSHSANMHMIPASPAIEDRLKAVREGQVVSLSGYLVEATASDGWRWRSSLTRSDSGAGACELVWVEEVTVR
jgi:hypothetical protein